MMDTKTLYIVHTHRLQHVNHPLAFDILGNCFDTHLLSYSVYCLHHAQIDFIDIDILQQWVISEDNKAPYIP